VTWCNFRRYPGTIKSEQSVKFLPPYPPELTLVGRISTYGKNRELENRSPTCPDRCVMETNGTGTLCHRR
jgi:hypothetical protein